MHAMPRLLRNGGKLTSTHPLADIDRVMTTPAQTGTSRNPTSQGSLPLGWRVVISGLLLVHLAAVLAGPWAFAPLHSTLADSCYSGLKPYIEGLGLGNGYRFFAPEPGPSHLVRYEFVRADGEKGSGVFPDLKTEWPRLRYHRHFMLSEFLNSLDAPGAPAALVEAYAESYARHLAHEHQAREVSLYMRRHRLPTMAEVRGGMKLTDASLYEEKLIGKFEEDNASIPAIPRSLTGG